MQLNFQLVTGKVMKLCVIGYCYSKGFYEIITDTGQIYFLDKQRVRKVVRAHV